MNSMGTPLKRAAALTALLTLTAVAGHAARPDSVRILGVPRIKQLRNYCGPACLASVVQFYGASTDQEAIGREVYDPNTGATNGADLLYFARRHGFAAYSWNSNIEDVKYKLSKGTPVIALQQNSLTDTSGHFRILTGFDDARQVFETIDPYYDDLTEISYADSRRLWRTKGFWALLVVPQDRDPFAGELGVGNPVLHMDLAYAMLKRGMYDDALKEAETALAIQPNNPFALAVQTRIARAAGAAMPHGSGCR